MPVGFFQPGCHVSNKSGNLYVVATPIGNLQDLSPRARDVLASADLILAEDTRHSQKLLAHHGISTSLRSCHEHNEEQRVSEMISALDAGQDVALISDAGTPLVSDPGFRLVAAAHGHGLRVIPVPGPSACIAALSVAGLPTDRFLFVGYLPAKQGARCKTFESLLAERATLIIYEAPHRIHAAVADAVSVFGGDRPAALVRELTKVYEEVHHGDLQSCLAWLEADTGRSKGEYVFLIQGASEDIPQDDQAAARILKILLTELPKSRATELTAKITGMKKNDLYRLALKMDE